MNFHLDNSTLKKGLAYGGLIFFFCLLQITLIPRYPIYGVLPDLVLSCVLATAMFEGAKFGAVTGVVTGFFIDAVGSVGLSLSPLLYMIFAYITGICAELIFRRGILSYTMVCVSAYFLRGFATYINVSVAWKEDLSTVFVFLRVILPEIVLSVLFSYVIYFIFRFVAKRFHRDYELKN